MYLLTFWDYENNCTFEWFDTEEEMIEYAKDPIGMSVSEIVDMIYVKDYEDLKDKYKI